MNKQYNVKDEYILIVNKTELYNKAKELGYYHLYLYNTIENILSFVQEQKKKKTAIVIAFFDGNAEEKELLEVIENNDIVQHFCFSRLYEWSELKTLSEAVTQFFTPDFLEGFLIHDGTIRTNDYVGKCGNCHKNLDPEDKYCRYCGTKRGDGKFDPYLNTIYCLYGPAVKGKYKCPNCGHLWVQEAAGQAPKYCTKCGSKVKTLEDRALWESYLIGYIGKTEPYEPDEAPILFTEEQIKKLLKIRYKKHDPLSCMQESFFTKLDSIGVNIPNTDKGFRYPSTEADGERIYLANKILNSKGKLVKRINGKTCPHCGSEYIGVYEYELIDDQYKTIDKNWHVNANETPITYATGFRVKQSELEQREKYFCLQCGKEF